MTDCQLPAFQVMAQMFRHRWAGFNAAPPIVDPWLPALLALASAVQSWYEDPGVNIQAFLSIFTFVDESFIF